MTRKRPAPRQLAVAAVGGSLIFASVLLAPFAAGAPPCDRGDADGDGMSNLAECNFGTLLEDRDSDSDGLWDPDEVHKYNTDPRNQYSDRDTLTDGREVNELKTDPTKTDTDGDGFSDGVEVAAHSNPTSAENYPRPEQASPDAGPGPKQGPANECPNGLPNDCDADGMLDDDETNGWNGFKTNPKDADSDDDEVNDGAEDDNGTNPLDPNDN